MKKVFLLYSILLIVLFSSFKLLTRKNNIEDKEKKQLELLILNLNKNHYGSIEINDEFSKKVYKTYLDSLDKKKLFFLKSDIEEFKKYETKLDDQIKKNDLSFFHLTYNRIFERMVEAKLVYTDLSKNPNEYKTEELQPRISYKTYATSKNEIKNRWRIFLKYLFLNRYIDKNTISTRTIEEFEKEIKENLLISINDTKLNHEYNRRDFYFSNYLVAISTSFDSHNLFLSSFERKKNIYNVKGAKVGIGINVQYRNNFLEVFQIFYGGPVWKNKKIEIGDQILKVAEENGKPVNVVGYTFEEIAKLIVGPVGSVIDITIKKPNGEVITVPIKREIVELNDSFVKSSIVENNNTKLGLISIPKFYKDVDVQNGRSTSKDVALELQQLKNDGVQGVLLDLRNNNDGSLEAAIEMAGLFISKGAIAQLKNIDKTIEIIQTTNEKPIWTGYLAILVNENSASTSEIFASTIQDYKRGIIIGDKATSGNGSIQKTINLNQFIADFKEGNFDYGELKVTNQKVYRVNGESIQNKGIKSDIVLPFINSKNKTEQVRSNALKPDKIKAANFFDLKNNFSKPIEFSKKRIENSSDFKLIKKRSEDFLKFNSYSQINLNLEKFKKLAASDSEYEVPLDVFLNYKSTLVFKSTDAEIKTFKRSTGLKEKREKWHENLSKDIYINEGMNILNDMISGL